MLFIGAEPCLTRAEWDTKVGVVSLVDVVINEDNEQQQQQTADDSGAQVPVPCHRWPWRLVQLPLMSSVSGPAVSFPRLEMLDIAGCGSLGEPPVKLQHKLKEI
ncbi:hypothetical protein GUJ93_ZPchr0013g35938 [Zizania palustris]|uniref:Uncharacterized protein n=1 Tax=Zizania palustris TaxID=103762 RepID=A0A8J6BXM8_ZIZPA|nr:hypothetical protein GUJ93_ZPchr0013g35938 [Zizania palustris]